MPERVYLALDGVFNSENFFMCAVPGRDRSERVWTFDDLDERTIMRFNKVLERRSFSVKLLKNWRLYTMSLRRVQSALINMGFGVTIQGLCLGEDKEEAIMVDSAADHVTPIILDTSLDLYPRLKNNVVLVNRSWGLRERDVSELLTRLTESR